MVVDCGGVGYELHISLHTYSKLTGQAEGLVYVHEIIRDDAHLLYGFGEQTERELFLLLVSVSGVGPNTARMMLSSLSPDELVRAIGGQDERALKGVKGVGLKTAQRILVDLKDKVQALGGGEMPITEGKVVGEAGRTAEEAVSALVMLGFQRGAAQKVVGELVKVSPSLAVENIIKDALRKL
jgi:Holliday junction DNA helicase RuvA